MRFFAVDYVNTCWLPKTCVSCALTLFHLPLFPALLSLPPPSALADLVQRAIFSAIMETQIKWLDSSQLERGMRHATCLGLRIGIGSLPRGRDDRLAIESISRRVREASLANVCAGVDVDMPGVVCANVCLGINASL